MPKPADHSAILIEFKGEDITLPQVSLQQVTPGQIMAAAAIMQRLLDSIQVGGLNGQGILPASPSDLAAIIEAAKRQVPS